MMSRLGWWPSRAICSSTARIIGVHVLHVNRTAAPDEPVDQVGGEGVDLPVLGLGGYHVEVTVDHQRAGVGVSAGHPGDHAGATLTVRRFEELRLQARLPHDRCAVFCRLALAFGVAFAPVGGVDANQVAAKLHDVDLCLRCRVHRSHGHHSTGRSPA